MKLLHTSDWHLGRVLHEQSLLEDQHYILTRVLDILKHEPHDGLLIAGDVYDRSLPSADAVSLLSWFLSSLRNFSDIPVIMIPGNHDSSRRLSYCSDILAASNLHIWGSIEDVGQPLILHWGEEKAAFFPIPFLDQGSFYVEDKPVRDHEAAMIEAMARIEASDTGDLPRVCIAHCFVSNGRVSDSERSVVGGSASVSPDLFSPFDYAALGHLHRPQEVGERAAYSGSLLKYSFSEYNDKKEVRSVELEKGNCKVHPISLSPRRDMVRLKGSFSSLLDSDEFFSYREDYIEAELTDSLLISNAMATLRKRFPWILSVKQQPPEAEERGDGAIDISDTKRTLEDDFNVFHQYLYGEEAAAEKKKLFLSLGKEGENQ